MSGKINLSHESFFHQKILMRPKELTHRSKAPAGVRVGKGSFLLFLCAYWFKLVGWLLVEGMDHHDREILRYSLGFI